MRRPVKPFVTEYKGPIRRPTHPAGPNQRSSPEDYSFLQAPSDAFARHGGDGASRASEDSYEAALRAADALFSPPSREIEPPPAMRSLDGGYGHSESGEGEGAGSESGRPGGRILRVIDEAPAMDLSEMEAERAPKRRGRKPGSKNRPKFIDSPGVIPAAPLAADPPARFAFADAVTGSVTADWSGYGLEADRAAANPSAKTKPPQSRGRQAAPAKAPAVPSLPLFARDDAAAHTSGRAVYSLDTDDEPDVDGVDPYIEHPDIDDLAIDAESVGTKAWAEAAPAAPRPALDGSKRETALAGVARKAAVSGDIETRNGERFAWVRTKLAPGERWKRRLPKVCW